MCKASLFFTNTLSVRSLCLCNSCLSLFLLLPLCPSLSRPLILSLSVSRSNSRSLCVKDLSCAPSLSQTLPAQTPHHTTRQDIKNVLLAKVCSQAESITHSKFLPFSQCTEWERHVAVALMAVNQASQPSQYAVTYSRRVGQKGNHTEKKKKEKSIALLKWELLSWIELIYRFLATSHHCGYVLSMGVNAHAQPKTSSQWQKS